MSIYNNIANFIKPILGYFGLNKPAQHYAENSVDEFMTQDLPRHINTGALLVTGVGAAAAAVSAGTAAELAQRAATVAIHEATTNGGASLTHHTQNIRDLALAPAKAFHHYKNIKWLNATGNFELKEQFKNTTHIDQESGAEFIVTNAKRYQ